MEHYLEADGLGTLEELREEDNFEAYKPKRSVGRLTDQLNPAWREEEQDIDKQQEDNNAHHSASLVFSLGLKRG